MNDCPAEEIEISVPRDKLAGYQAWVQGVQYPHCPRCERQMAHVFQVDSEDNIPYLFGDAGCGHLIQCPDHKEVVAAVAKMRVQRRPLHDFASVVSAQAVTNAPMRHRLTPIARAVLDALRTDPITAGIRLTLTAAILGVEEFEQELKVLIDGNVPISAVAAEAIAAIEQFGQTTHRTKLPQLEARLAAADDSHLRLLAFNALLVQARDHNRWDKVRCNRLNAYRNDPAPLVAIRAQFFFDADSA